MPCNGLVCAGELQKRIEFQRFVESGALTPQGGIDGEWETVAEVRAKIAPRAGSEVYQNDRIEAQNTHEIIVRYRDDIDASCRIVYRGRVFGIDSIVNYNESDAWLIIGATEGADREGY